MGADAPPVPHPAADARAVGCFGEVKTFSYTGKPPNNVKTFSFPLNTCFALGELWF